IRGLPCLLLILRSPKLFPISNAPIVAVSDYVRAVPEAIRQHIPKGRSFVTLGTDGFGRSDTRTVLREFFGVSAQHIIDAAQSCS
uniref:transketolase-like TK C-terminal-containing protein n=1 Tax=Orrella sp. TaxID=1921583 RepID=UPI00405566E2